LWAQLWERYVQSKLDYKCTAEVLQSKRREAGADCLRLVVWLEPLGAEMQRATAVALLREIFTQQAEVKQGESTSNGSVEPVEPVKVHATGGATVRGRI
jgi:hypothetical protein